MNLRAPWIVVLVGTPCVAQTVSTPWVEPCAEREHSCLLDGCGKANALALRHAAGQPVADAPAGFTPREALTDTDLISVDLDMELDIPNEEISGSNEMVVAARVNGLTEFTFMLRSNFAITQVLVNGAPAALPASVGSYGRRVTLDRAYAAGEQFTVKVFYDGPAVSRGFGSIEFTTQNGQPLVSALSEPYYAATWWPVKDGDFAQPGDNGDKSIGRIAVTAPSTLKSVANGLLEGIDALPGGRTRYRWRTNYPTATYLYTFSTTNYNQWTQNYVYPLPGGGTGTMPVEFSIYPASDTPANRTAWERCIPMLSAFRGVFGEYPFIDEKYGIYQFPFGGGMEHQTYTGQTSFGESLTAHELAHQWWGNAVTCKTWNDIWLNEGFATYGEAIWEERKPGSSGLPALRNAMNARRPAATDDTVYVTDVSNLGRIFSSTFTYRKGGWVVHMLRGVVGDADFFDGLAAYRSAFEGDAATTADLRTVMETVSGRSLADFFDQWVYRIGAPSYAYGFQNVTINGQRYVKLSLRQTQDVSWGLPGGYFAMPIDVTLTGAGGSAITEIENTARAQHFLLPATQNITGVTLDEFDWILNDGKTSEAYTAGPARLTAASPAPGEALVTGPTQVRLWFNELVTPVATSYAVSGPGGAVPFTASTTGTPSVATLTFGAPLAPGAYTVTVTRFGGPGATNIDGEIVGGTLPSGNGIDGGAAVYTFTVGAPGCDSIDFNGDGLFPDNQDIEDFLAVFGGGGCPTGACGDLDFNNDGLFPDNEDVEAFFRVFGGGNC